MMVSESNNISSHSPSLASLLRFYQAAGVDVACEEEPVDRFAKIEPSPPQSNQPVLTTTTALKDEVGKPRPLSRPPITTVATIENARRQVQEATNLEELRQLLLAYEGCSLKLTAKNTCFADGTPMSALMLVGEAPGRDEDLEGRPFVGRSGQLLNRILAAIGLQRDQVYIANVVPWRPPGNRVPTAMEIELCRPFIERQIELARPQFLVALGGPATKFLTGHEGILKLRGRWLDHKTAAGTTIPVMPTLHPAYLLRTPAHKKFVWQDFLQIQQRLLSSA